MSFQELGHRFSCSGKLLGLFPPFDELRIRYRVHKCATGDRGMEPVVTVEDEQRSPDIRQFRVGHTKDSIVVDEQRIPIFLPCGVIGFGVS